MDAGGHQITKSRYFVNSPIKGSVHWKIKYFVLYVRRKKKCGREGIHPHHHADDDDDDDDDDDVCTR